MTKKKDRCEKCKKTIGVNVPYVYRGGAVLHEACGSESPPTVATTTTTTGTGAVWSSIAAAKKIEGRKEDAGKPRPDLLPPKALLGVAAVLAHGAQKYGPDNWRKVDNAKARYTAALGRHLLLWMCGEQKDPDSGLPHLDHLACCVLFLSELEK